MKATKELFPIVYGIHPSPFGKVIIGLAKDDVCFLSFADTKSASKAEFLIRDKWPDAELSRNEKKTAPYVKKIFSSQNGKQTFNVLAKGSEFEMKVWQALLSIPFGMTVSYAMIAQMIGKPKAARAVGTACGKNSIAYLIPCHRVLPAGGKLGGYRWGIKRKEAILKWEASQAR